MTDLNFYRRYLYPDLSDEDILKRIESHNRFVVAQKEFLKTVQFRQKKK